MKWIMIENDKPRDIKIGRWTGIGGARQN